MKNEKLRVAFYKRVSTEEQAATGYGLAFQEEKLRAYVELHDYVIEGQHIYQDEGYSGTLPIEKRPALEKMIEAAGRKEFDAVIVYRLDRLGRKILLILDIVQKLDNCGISFISATEPFDTSNAFGRYLLTSLGALAELERETIKERTQGGRRMAAKSGKWIWGTPPYGYSLDPITKKLKIIKKEAKWVKEMFEWLVNEGLPLSAIQKRLNQLSVPCYNKRKRKRDELRGYWHKKSVARLLCNPIFTGTTHFYRFKRNFKGVETLVNKDLQHDESQWIEFKCPQIVSPELFRKGTTQLLFNKEMAQRNLQYDYLFNKLIYCGVCGKKLFAALRTPKKPTHNPYRYYHGVGREKWRKPIVEDGRCGFCGNIGEARLLPIWDTIKSLLQNPDYMISKLRVHGEASPVNGDLDKRLEMVQKEMVSVIQKRKKLDKVFLESDSISHEAYQKMLFQNKKEEVLLKKEIASLKQTANRKRAVPIDSDYFNALFKRLQTKLKDLSYKNISQITHLLIEKLILYKDKQEVEVKLKILNPTLLKISPSTPQMAYTLLGDHYLY